MQLIQKHGKQYLTDAKKIAEAATAKDGNPPVSDQAYIAVTNNKRHLTLFYQTPTHTKPSTHQKNRPQNQPNPAAFTIQGENEIDLVVHPAHRGRGIARSVLATLLAARARQPLKCWQHGQNPAARALLAGSGFKPARTLLQMRVAVPASAPPPHVLPGFELISFASAKRVEQGRDWVAVNSAAFASHPEQGRLTVDDFLALTGEDWFLAEDLLLLYAVPAGSSPAGSTSAELLHDGVVRVEPALAESVPAGQVTADSLPADSLPTVPFPAGPLPATPVTADPLPIVPVSAGSARHGLASLTPSPAGSACLARQGLASLDTSRQEPASRESMLRESSAQESTSTWHSLDGAMPAVNGTVSARAVHGSSRTPHASGRQLAGYAWVKTVPGGGESRGRRQDAQCELYAIAVSPDFAGQGFGRLLLQAAFHQMLTHSPLSISLYVDADNIAAVRLYEKAGFTVSRTSVQWLLAGSE